MLPVQISECDIVAGKAASMEAAAIDSYKSAKAETKATAQALKEAAKDAKLKDSERISFLERRIENMEKHFGGK